jgi:phosphoribosyl 1,2-cyclic phosphodiesterase
LRRAFLSKRPTSMSTFSGHFDEFPDWRADRFMAPESGKPQTCDYLLSHIHSDHLQGDQCLADGCSGHLTPTQG